MITDFKALTIPEGEVVKIEDSLGRVLWTKPSALPYDAEIEYLESTGEQRIPINDIVLTGYDNVIETEITYLGYSNNNAWVAWYSCYTSENHDTYRIIRYGTASNQVLLYNGAKANGGGVSFNVASGTTYNIVMRNNTATINGTQVSLITYRGTTNSSPLMVFLTGSILRISYFKITKGDNVILDLIPVRVGQVGYMYDKVSKQLFGNAGTGAFSCGPDK